MKEKNVTGVITGKAMWAKLNKTEVIGGVDTGNYTIVLEPEQDELEQFLATCEEVWNNYLETNTKKLKGVPNFGVHEDDDGVQTLKFKMKSLIKLKDGTMRNLNVPIFDSMGKVITSKVKDRIGNGSKVCISYSLFPFVFSNINFGISLRLQAVQILELVDYQGGSADTFGFSKGKGTFNGDDIEENEEEIEIPFTDDDDGEEVESDF